MVEKKKKGLGDEEGRERYVDYVDRELKKQGIDYANLPNFHLKREKNNG